MTQGSSAEFALQHLWDDDEPIKGRVDQWGLDIPAWIRDDITPRDIAAICEGGCASGAYMPAVTYWQALQTMGSHGDDVFDYLETALGEVPAPSATTPGGGRSLNPSAGESWSGMACHYLSCAVELWAQAAADAMGPTQEEEV